MRSLFDLSLVKNTQAIFKWKTVATLVVGVFTLVPLGACNVSSSGEIREWTPADHDQSGVAPTPQVSARPPSSATAQNLTELAWQKNCAQCHGPRGRGDGPQAAMLRVPDLARADWQDRASDAEIAETIRKGRNKMPPFDLPPAVLEGLVKRIRASRERQ